jgi:hypothetical protein
LRRVLSSLTACPLLENNTNDTPYSLVGDTLISGYVSKRFALFNVMKNGRPLGNGNFPMGGLVLDDVVREKVYFPAQA